MENESYICLHGKPCEVVNKKLAHLRDNPGREFCDLTPKQWWCVTEEQLSDQECKKEGHETRPQIRVLMDPQVSPLREIMASIRGVELVIGK